MQKMIGISGLVGGSTSAQFLSMVDLILELL